MRIICLTGACALALAACEGNRDGDGEMDAGRDSGSAAADPCSTDDDAIGTLGCNGAVLGAARPENDFGGRCTPSDTDEAGTCTGANAICAGERGEPGICLTTCTPTADTYVSTGGCPSGSRCFDLRDTAGVAVCFPDCNDGSECTTGVCDEEGSCVPPPPPEEDGGTPAIDAGPPAIDAGV